MIRSVEIKNVGCVRDATLELSPLTVLVGPNSSGKSTLLSTLYPVAPLPTWLHLDGPSTVAFHYTDGLIKDVKWHTGKSVQVVWRTRRDPGMEQWRSTAQVSFHTSQTLRLDLNRTRQVNQAAEATSLASDGSNLTNVVASLGRKLQGELAQQLCRLVPVFSDLDVRPQQTGYQQLRFQDRWRPETWYRPEEVSDGTMLMLAFLTLQYQPSPPDLLAIEEPERGLHPYLLGELIALLRGFSTGKIGRKPMQVVIATHSAELLDFVEPGEVRFLSRSAEDGGVKIDQVDTSDPGWEQAFQEYRQSLGEAWLAGGLGGVPSGS